MFPAEARPLMEVREEKQAFYDRSGYQVTYDYVDFFKMVPRIIDVLHGPQPDIYDGGSGRGQGPATCDMPIHQQAP